MGEIQDAEKVKALILAARTEVEQWVDQQDKWLTAISDIPKSLKPIHQIRQLFLTQTSAHFAEISKKWKSKSQSMPISWPIASMRH